MKLFKKSIVTFSMFLSLPFMMLGMCYEIASRGFGVGSEITSEFIEKN